MCLSNGWLLQRGVKAYDSGSDLAYYAGHMFEIWGVTIKICIDKEKIKSFKS